MIRLISSALSAIILGALWQSQLAVAAEESMLGFTDDAALQQEALERKFDQLVSAEDQAQWMRRLSQAPHHVGSEAGKDNVDYMASLFREWGFDVEIEAFDVLLPTPKERRVELLSPGSFVAGLAEDAVAGDPSTAAGNGILPPYNAFSADGDVTGELVYVNYGIPEDYELLERYGIDVAGKIVIARYGKSWRGIKPKLAAEHGAIGTIIYSDPADDGYSKGMVYPEGPYKNESGVQRGSVMDMPLYPGDVLTPMRGATAGAKRLAREQAPTITKIPVLPISYRDALPLLKAIAGPVAPEGWRGALPLTYRMGPGAARVRLHAAFDWNQVTAYNVIARMTGRDFPNEWVIRGNHHDGWNHGAADPISGLVALMSEAKAVGELAAGGNRPSRTIVYAAWDAEEPGLIGSTEWVETHAKALSEHAVAYINTDGNSRGFIQAGGSHTLEQFLNGILNVVGDPQTDATIAARKRANIHVHGDQDEAEDLKTKGSLRMAPLGSGSDYTPFLQHLGIASLNISFGGEGPGGSYHTAYDTYEHFTRFRDPGFEYGVALTQVSGRATLRLANARVLPFEFTQFAENAQHYMEQIEQLADDMRKRAARNNELLVDGSYQLALDPKGDLAPPVAQAWVPHFNFAPLKNALADLAAAADVYGKSIRTTSMYDASQLRKLNRMLFESERLMTRSEGLPGRPWYRHFVYAPGFYTGYGVKTFPAVREAIEAESFDQVNPQVEVTAAMIRKLANHVADLAGTDEVN